MTAPESCFASKARLVLGLAVPVVLLGLVVPVVLVIGVVAEGTFSSALKI